MKRSALMRRTPLKRGMKPLQARPRRERVTKGGRVILSAYHYAGLCYDLWVEVGKRCEKCYRRLPEFSTRLADHKIKRSQGGSDTRENLQILCGECHDVADNQGGKLSAKEKARLSA